MIANFLMLFFFILVGDTIAFKMRSLAFDKMMKMPVSWFDIETNQFKFYQLQLTYNIFLYFIIFRAGKLI